MKYKVFLTLIVAIFLIGLIGSIAVFTSGTKSNIRILSGGEEVYAADLSTAQDTTFDVESEGHINTVEIKDHQIRVAQADCPDQTCVHMGWLKSSGTPIVCLPHQLVIEFTDDTSDIDAVTR